MKYAVYAHGGSGNHGCEALARTVSALIPYGSKIKLFSKRPDEDEKYITDWNFDVVLSGRVPAKTTVEGFVSAFKMKFLKQKLAFVKPAYRNLLQYCNDNTVALSIGGDNYCYDGVPDVLAELNKLLNKKGTKTVLLGCSIEPELLQDVAVKEDMERYSLITVRESITYTAMKNAGIKTDVRMIPDSAFLLPAKEHVLPQGFICGNTIGINISPLVKGLEKQDGIVVKSYCHLIEYILAETDMVVALIPHVVWKVNNDLDVLHELYEKYCYTGRVLLIEDCNAEELKFCISQCRFLIAARTHASIAAYSTAVPTLVVGYSVKSVGIARDLFGTHENYVLSVEDIHTGNELVAHANWLFQNEKSIRAHLTKTIPEYILPIREITAILEGI